jgi:hypothetical protein
MPRYLLLFLMMVVWPVWKYMQGRKTGNNKKVSKLHPIVPFLYRFPASYMVLTNTISLTMWFVGTCLATLRIKWVEYVNRRMPKRLFMRRRAIRGKILLKRITKERKR